MRSNQIAFDRLWSDERAIEGLPIRLVIALVVGVASLSVMMGMLSGIGGLGVTEVHAEPEPDVVTPGQEEISIRVVDDDGTGIEGATVIVRGDTASLENGIRHAETGDGGEATLTINPELPPNQRDGTLEIDIQPPGGGEYSDRRENAEILVIEQ